MENITNSDIARCLNKGEKEFLWELNLKTIYQKYQVEADECFDSVRNNLKNVTEWESDIDLNEWKYFDHLSLHCGYCIDNVLTDDSKIVFTALRLRNYILKNMDCLFDLPNYEKEENVVTLNKLESTIAIIKMRKTDKIIPMPKLGFPYNEFYAKEKFPSENLVANEDKAYNLICNGEIVNIEPFPNNLHRMAKIFYDKGLKPTEKARNSEAMVKILATIFSSNIDLNSKCFGRSLSNAYTALLPLQVDYYFDKESENPAKYAINGKCIVSFGFLEKINHVHFGRGIITRKIIHVWLASKLINKIPMTEVMDYMRINVNTDLMENDLEVEEEIKKVLIANLQLLDLLPDNVSLSDQLRTYEKILMEYEGYIEYNPGLAHWK